MRVGVLVGVKVRVGVRVDVAGSAVLVNEGGSAVRVGLGVCVGGGAVGLGSQGPVTQHSEENLVSSDRGVVMLRSMLRQVVDDVEAGKDPLNVSFRAITASHLVHATRYDEAIDEVHKALDMDPGNSAARFILVEAYHAKGLLERALDAAEQAYATAPWSGNIVGLFGGLLAHAGQTARGEALMEKLGQPGTNPFSRVFFHVLRSEIDLAADWYENAIEQRELFAIICAPAPIIKPLRESPRWARLATLMNLPQS